VIRANLEDGDMTVTACVVKGVQTMCVTKITEDVRASLDSGDVTVTTGVVKGVRRAIPSRANAPNASKTITMGINVNIRVMLAVLIRHVTLYQESAMHVGMVILEHTVTCHATAYVLKVDAIGSLGRAMNVWVCIRTVNYVTHRAAIPVFTIDVTEQAAARLDA